MNVGSIKGNIVDEATAKPIAGVLITATSPHLPGEQVVQSDSSGNYNVPELPAGEYTLRFTMNDYKPYSQSHVKVTDHPVTVNVRMLPEAIPPANA